MAVTNITDGTAYFIRTPFNGNCQWYIDMRERGPDVIHYSFTGGKNQKWTAIQSVDKWRFRNNHNTNAYLANDVTKNDSQGLVVASHYSDWKLELGPNSNVYRIYEEVDNKKYYVSWSQDDSSEDPFFSIGFDSSSNLQFGFEFIDTP